MREGQARVLTTAEIKRLFYVAPFTRHFLRNRALLLFSHATGAKVGEIARLKMSDLIVDGKVSDVICITKSDHSKNRSIYFTNHKAREAMSFYLLRRIDKYGLWKDSDPLFLSQKRGHFSANTLQMLLTRLYKLSELDGAKSHSGRRSFAVKLIREDGVDLKNVQTLLGIQSKSAMVHYVQDNPDLLKKIASKAIEYT